MPLKNPSVGDDSESLSIFGRLGRADVAAEPDEYICDSDGNILPGRPELRRPIYSERTKENFRRVEESEANQRRIAEIARRQWEDDQKRRSWEQSQAAILDYQNRCAQREPPYTSKGPLSDLSGPNPPLALILNVTQTRYQLSLSTLTPVPEQMVSDV